MLNISELISDKNRKLKINVLDTYISELKSETGKIQEICWILIYLNLKSEKEYE